MEFTTNLKLKKPKLSDKSDFTELDFNWDKLDEEYQILKLDFKEFKNNANRFNLTLDTLKNEVESFNTKFESLELSITELKSELEEKINNINNNSSYATETITNLENEINNLKTEIENIKNSGNTGAVNSINLMVTHPMSYEFRIEEPYTDINVKATTTIAATFTIFLNGIEIRSIENVQAIDEIISGTLLTSHISGIGNGIKIIAYSSEHNIQEQEDIVIYTANDSSGGDTSGGDTNGVLVPELDFGDNLVAYKNMQELIITKDDPAGNGLMRNFAEIPEHIYKLRELAILDVTIKDGVENIGKSVFRQLDIRILKIGASVYLIDEEAFYQSDVDEIIFEGNNLLYIERFAFRYNGIVNLTLPDSLIEIKNDAFAYGNIENVTFGNNLKVISMGAFHSNKISNLILPENLTTLYAEAFDDNILTELTIPDSVTTIRSKAFQSNRISNLTIGNGVEHIPDNCFEFNNLENIIFGNKINYIGRDAFKDNIELKTIVLPDSLEKIDYGAFENTSLEEITIGSNVDIKFYQYHEFGVNYNGLQNFHHCYKDVNSSEAGTYTWDGTAWSKTT